MTSVNPWQPEHDAMMKHINSTAVTVEPTDNGEAIQTAGPVVVRLDTVNTRPVEWIYRGKLARGKLTLLAGDGGLGKSFVSLAWASAISRGRGFVDDPDTREPGGVVLLSAEDDAADTIVPRLNAAAADLGRIIAIEGVRALDSDGQQCERVVDLSTDLRHVEQALEQVDNPTCIIVDPISAYYPRVDSHNNSEVRSCLAQLAAMAERWRVAVLLITHLNKGSNRSAIHRIQGSVAYGAACRMVWGVVKDEDDADRRLVLPVKNNLAQDRQGLAYTLRDAGMGTPQVHWEAEPVDMSADDAMNEEREPTRKEQAADWLRQFIREHGPTDSDTVKMYADDAGHSWASVRRAKQAAGVVSAQRRDEAGNLTGWVWRAIEHE